VFQQSDAENDQHEASLFGTLVEKNECLPPKREVFSILSTAADYRYQSPLPSIKGRVVEGDVRKASSMFRAYKEKVRLRHYLAALSGYYRLPRRSVAAALVLGRPMKPITGQGKMIVIA